MAKVVFFKVCRCPVLLVNILLLIAFTFNGLAGKVSANGNTRPTLLNTAYIGSLHLSATSTHNLKDLYFFSKFFDMEDSQEDPQIEYGTSSRGITKDDHAISLGTHFASQAHSHSGFNKYYILYCCLKISSFSN